MNPYKVLGVSENATQDEIRKAYLALAATRSSRRSTRPTSC